MTPAASATGAGFHLRGIDFYPLTIGNYTELDVEIQNQFRDEAYAWAQGKNMSPAHLQAHYNATLLTSAGLTTNTPEGRARVHSVTGSLAVLRISSRGKFTRAMFEAEWDEDDGVGLEEAFEAEVEQLFRQVMDLTRVPEEDDKATEASEGEPDFPDAP
jgi:hypothetical protein